MQTEHPDLSRHRDVDFLRDQGGRPAWFGLGFIQLKLTDDTRMHFWHPEMLADVSEEELHDHHYSFRSRIMVGSMTHEEWRFQEDPAGDHDLVRVSCKPGVTADPEPLARGVVVRGNAYTMSAGSEYRFGEEGFHRIRATRAVTFLTRGPVLKDFANVLRPLEAPVTCPFARTVPEDLLWDCIADLLEGRLPNPGYHLSEIEKGIVGEPSKIMEETLEFLDAVRQKSGLMAMVELADLVGSVKAWLAENHPTIGLADLEVMADITARAFRNGHR